MVEFSIPQGVSIIDSLLRDQQLRVNPKNGFLVLFDKEGRFEVLGALFFLTHIKDMSLWFVKNDNQRVKNSETGEIELQNATSNLMRDGLVIVPNSKSHPFCLTLKDFNVPFFAIFNPTWISQSILEMDAFVGVVVEKKYGWVGFCMWILWLAGSHSLLHTAQCTVNAPVTAHTARH